MIFPLRIIMADEPLTGDKAASAFFDLVAIGYACASADLFFRGDFRAGAESLAATVILFLLGVGWPVVRRLVTIQYLLF